MRYLPYYDCVTNQTETLIMLGIPAKSAIATPLETRVIAVFQQLVTQ